MTYLKIKRLLDLVISASALIILAPFFAILILSIKIDSKGPILFKQNRIGKDKKEFIILKFRTMKIETPKNIPTHLLDAPEQWITKTGKFLRKTSLDELPQLINILKGDMSIVGPRPALWNQFDLITERDKYGVNNILPGLTGYAQIKGRDSLAISEKAKLDGEYFKKMGFFLDIKIILSTVLKVFRFEGVVEGGTGTIGESSKESSNKKR